MPTSRVLRKWVKIRPCSIHRGGMRSNRFFVSPRQKDVKFSMNCADIRFEDLMRKGVADHNAKAHAWIPTQIEPVTHLLSSSGHGPEQDRFNPSLSEL